MEVSPAMLDRIQKIAKAEMNGRAQITLLEDKLHDIDRRLRRSDRGPFRYNLKQRKRVLENVRNVYKKFVQKKTMQATKLVIQNFTESLMGVRSRLEETVDPSLVSQRFAGVSEDSLDGVSVNVQTPENSIGDVSSRAYLLMARINPIFEDSNVSENSNDSSSSRN